MQEYFEFYLLSLYAEIPMDKDSVEGGD